MSTISARSKNHPLNTGNRLAGHVMGSDLSQSPRSGLFGCVESIDDSGIRGWLVDAARPGSAQPVSAWLDGVRIFSGMASLLRPDVSDLLNQHAHCGFQFKWRDSTPTEPLAVGARRKGELLVMTASGQILPLACTFSADDVYRKVQFYAERQALVMGLVQVSDPSALDDTALIAASFDEAFYLAMYPEVRSHAQGPLDHFMTEGWRLGYDPCAEFQTSYYLATNNDVANSGINPFLHYLRAGKAEGRHGSRPGCYQMDALAELKTIEQTVALWRRKDTLRCMSSRSLQDELEQRIREGNPSRIVLSFSHDDYVRNVGGIQLCITKEQQAFNAAGALYLHLSPWQALPTLAPNTSGDRLALRVICDGREIGNVLGSDLLGALALVEDRIGAGRLAMVVHALHGHAPELIAHLQRKLSITDSYFWLHDYFTVCNGYNLLRNNVAYCGAPPMSSQACSICVHGETRPKHTARIRALFDSVPFEVVSPSSHTASTWERLSGLPHRGVVVHPHCEFMEDGRRLSVDRLALDDALSAPPEPVKVAFLGHPTLHKGWPVFEALVRRYCHDPRYEFWHLGSAASTRLPVRFREVKVLPGLEHAMIDALSEEAIDVVLQWSIWPETFGITARECSAAGVAMVVTTGSGAVAEHVRATSNGWVLGADPELVALFEGDDVVDEVERRRQQGAPVGSLRWSRMTCDMVMPATVKSEV